jgi:Replication initiator protein, pSAM2
MTVPAVTLAPRTGPDLGAGATAGTLFQAASRDDFRRWEQQLASTGHCAHPIRLAGRIDAIDRATGQTALIYDTTTEPGGVLLTGCGNRREAVCPGCSDIYKGDARQIIRTGLTGGKGMPDTITSHPCVFATLTAPGFGPVHTIRTARNGRALACRPRRDAHHRRCPHGRDISCPRHHQLGDPRLGQPLCPDCYDYIGHVLFNALGPELWRRFTIYLPRHMARLLGTTQKALRSNVSVRFVKVAEYQARGIVHYHAIIRLDAPGDSYQPPPPRYDTTLLTAAIQATAAAISCDTAALLARMLWRAAGSNPADPLPVIDPGLGRILRFGTQIDTRAIRHDTGGLPGTGTALSAQAVANYIAKYATKTTGAPGLPHRPLPSPAAIARLRASSHHKQLIRTCWELGKEPVASQLALNRWTHMLGYRGHFLTKSRRYSVTFTQLRQARVSHRRVQRHPDGQKDPWGRDLDDRIVLIISAWQYAGTGHATSGEHQLALAAAARAREHDQIAREEAWMT